MVLFLNYLSVLRPCLKSSCCVVCTYWLSVVGWCRDITTADAVSCLISTVLSSHERTVKCPQQTFQSVSYWHVSAIQHTYYRSIFYSVKVLIPNTLVKLFLAFLSPDNFCWITLKNNQSDIWGWSIITSPWNKFRNTQFFSWSDQWTILMKKSCEL